MKEYFSRDICLQGKRLTLRRLSPAHAQDMFEYACRPDTCRYLLWDVHPYYSYTLELLRHVQKEYERGTFFDFAVILKEGGKMIGTVGFTSYDPQNKCAEVGYVISPVYQGKGYATEALETVMNFAFCELGLNRVEAHYMVGNDASRRVMEKCGMRFEGVYRKKLLVKGLFRDIGICSILKEEYRPAQRENIYESCNKKRGILGLFHKN